jgi:uncharacterized protein YndB with AHSA1/START domain
MTARPEARATVQVSAPPVRAFEAFTAEISSWWVPGPINYFDAGRSPTMHVEPGVGGRVLERYADGELVIARVTDWEPGRRVCWDGVVDDSRTVVTFEAIDEDGLAGTTVAVHQYLREGGERAFLFWPNVIGWLVPWCATVADPEAPPTRAGSPTRGADPS